MDQVIITLLAELFATHPEVDKFYLTSDNQAFIQDHHAEAHAQTLEDKKVKPHAREAVQFKAVDADDTEKETLQARYFELYGKKANHLLGIEKLKAAIAEKEAQ
ncbi:MAG: hypothetical protein H7289_07840 [Mucilaginibacter sp.]|nr:hypothetical protein [Mucilaginibacter sp.]